MIRMWVETSHKNLRLGESLRGVRIGTGDLIMETYVDMFEREIFSHDLRVHYQRNISKEEQEALENLRGYDDIIF